MISLPPELRDLDTAEDFLDHFGVEYDHARVQRLRLHILQRFHDYLSTAEETPADEGELTAVLRTYLTRAYDDFVQSDPLKERVFKVLRDAEASKEPQQLGHAFIPLSEVRTETSGDS